MAHVGGVVKTMAMQLSITLERLRALFKVGACAIAACISGCLSLSQGNLVNIEDSYYREHRYKSYATVPWGVARCCTSTSLKACLLGLVAAVGHHWIRDVGNNPCLTLVRSSWGSVRGRCFVVDGCAEAWVGCRQADCGVDPVLGVDCWSAVLAFNRCVDNGHFFHRGLVEGC